MINLTSNPLKLILTFLIFLVILNSCTSEVKATTFKNASIDNSFDADISAAFNKATGNSELSKAINANIENTIISTISSPESKSDLKTVLKDFNSEFVNFKKEFPDDSEPVWELNIETELTYQSEDIITIALNTYEFKGGAHGNDKIKFLNLNAKSGAILKQNDLIKNIADFKVLAKTYFLQSLEIEEEEEEDLKMENFFFGKAFQLPENIGFSEDGLVLLYNVYELASYDQGYTEFVIPFEDVEFYLKLN
tara:strand:- start:825 stop:1577 length:753 start_codon:yes stop_codon:yes gene_type:complete